MVGANCFFVLRTAELVRFFGEFHEKVHAESAYQLFGMLVDPGCLWKFLHDELLYWGCHIRKERQRLDVSNTPKVIGSNLSRFILTSRKTNRRIHSHQDGRVFVFAAWRVWNSHISSLGRWLIIGEHCLCIRNRLRYWFGPFALPTIIRALVRGSLAWISFCIGCHSFALVSVCGSWMGSYISIEYKFDKVPPIA